MGITIRVSLSREMLLVKYLIDPWQSNRGMIKFREICLEGERIGWPEIYKGINATLGHTHSEDERKNLPYM